MKTNDARPRLWVSVGAWFVLLLLSAGLLLGLSVGEPCLRGYVETHKWEPKPVVKDGATKVTPLLWIKCDLTLPSAAASVPDDGGPCGQGALQIVQRRQDIVAPGRPVEAVDTKGSVAAAANPGDHAKAGKGRQVAKSGNPPEPRQAKPAETTVETISEWRFPSSLEMQSMAAITAAAAAYGHESDKSQAEKILDATLTALTTLGVFGAVMSCTVVIFGLLRLTGATGDLVSLAKELAGMKGKGESEPPPPP